MLVRCRAAAVLLTQTGQGSHDQDEVPEQSLIEADLGVVQAC
ncbi:hypothetical protein [Nonomuraea fuscirosea]